MRFTSLFRCLLGVGVFMMLLGGVPAWGQSDGSSEEQAQPDTTDEWSYDVTARLNASQAAYKDWEEGGGSNSLAFVAGLGGEANRVGERWRQKHELRFAFGLIDQEGQETRKAEDQIRWNSNLRYQGDGFFRLFNPTLAGNLRTQFAAGFDYESNPFEGEVDPPDERLDREPPVRSSAFFAPAFITESLGLTYEPLSSLTLRFGGASKQTVVRERDFRVLYGLEDQNAVRVEAGAEFVASFDKQLTESIRYRSDLNTFFSFNQPEDPPDALWENVINLKVNDWLSTDLEFVALFDRDISRTIQLKETLSVGISFDLL